MGASTLTVTAATLQSITVTPAGPSIARGTTIQLTATGAYSDGTTQDLTGQAAWSSSDDAVAAVSNDAASKGLAAGLAPGTATITAALAGLTGATVLTVTAATLQSIAVTPVNPSLARGTTVQLAATGSYSDGSTQDLTAQVGWASSDVSVATISNAPPTRGLATAIAAGTTTLSATLGLVVGTTTLTVTAATLDAITVTPVGASIAAGTTLQLAATGTYSDGTTQDLTFQVTWTSSDAAIATVSNAPSTKGLATGVGAGTATLTAAFQGVSGTTTLGVTAATLQALVITPADPTIAAGTTVQFSASGSYSDGSVQDLTTQVSWISSNTTFATVSNAPGSEGLAAARSAGTTTISATFSGVTGTTTLTVSGVSLQSIIVSPADATIARGTTLQYTAFGVYSDGSTQDITTLVTWASSDTAIAVVSNSPGTQGLVTALAAGVTTVSAALSGIGGSTGLTVTQATLVSIAVTPPQKPLKVGRTQQYTATGTYSDGSRQVITTQVTWSSSNTAAAVISNAPGSQGVATAVAVGSTEIGAQSGNVSGAARLNVTP
jgi:hypothetical protein